MPHPKKKLRIMTYYLIKNRATGWYFCNKSQRPEASVRHHFHRALNPEREDYNCKFYQDIRQYGEEGFDISFSLELPAGVTRRAHYMPPYDIVSDE